MGREPNTNSRVGRECTQDPKMAGSGRNKTKVKQHHKIFRTRKRAKRYEITKVAVSGITRYGKRNLESPSHYFRGGWGGGDEDRSLGSVIEETTVIFDRCLWMFMTVSGLLLVGFTNSRQNLRRADSGQK